MFGSLKINGEKIANTLTFKDAKKSSFLCVKEKYSSYKLEPGMLVYKTHGGNIVLFPSGKVFTDSYVPNDLIVNYVNMNLDFKEVEDE